MNMQTQTIQDKLDVNKFNTDELNSHITIDKTYPDKNRILTIIHACPAGLYQFADDGEVQFDHLGCLECGTCRVLGCGQMVKEWNYPAGGMGISYRMG